MMKSNFFFLAVMAFFSGPSFAQNDTSSIDVTYTKTTSILFDYPIINVDRGSKDVLAQKVEGTENALQVKAARRSFPETNLTVVTGDGAIHHFLVNYTDNPASQIYSSDKSVKLEKGVNSKVLLDICQRIRNHSKGRTFAKKRKNKMSLHVKGIYISDDMIFYRINIRNNSNIDYDVQSLKFFINDKQRVKRTASQEFESIPVFVYNKKSKIKGESTISTIYVLKKFTIPDAKALDIEMFEKDGGRNLNVRIENRDIIRAERVPVY